MVNQFNSDFIHDVQYPFIQFVTLSVLLFFVASPFQPCGGKNLIIIKMDNHYFLSTAVFIGN